MATKIPVVVPGFTHWLIKRRKNMNRTKLDCYASQCCYWDEACGCTKKESADNGCEPCGEFEELYEYKVYVIVERGMVAGIYANKPDISIEILDLDGNEDSEKDGELRKRTKEIEEKYHELYCS